MRLVRFAEESQHGGVLRLHHLTDMHVGAPDFDEEAFLVRRALIEQDPHARWTLGGDAGDLIRHNDRRYQPTELHPRYRQATDIRLATMEHLLELLGPIKEKCWGIADGNHERHVDEHFGGKFGVELATNLGIPERWVGYRGFIQVLVTVKSRGTKLALLIDLQHGWQQGRLKGAPVVQAERELGMTEADIVLRGHNHQPAAHPFKTLGVSGGGQGRIRSRLRCVVNGGSWRHGYRVDLSPVNPKRLSEVEGDLWSETKGFRAEPVGGPVLILTFDQGNGADRRNRAHYRPALIEHTIVEGFIDAQRLGLSRGP